MSDITIKEVNGRRDLRHFIEFPNKLFKEVDVYVPALNRDEYKLLRDTNPSLEHCDRKLWLAYRDGKIVGRVAGIINHTVNEHWHKKAVRFGWFDFIEDIEVCKALLNTVIEWGKSKGMNQVDGPLGFTDMDKECWVIDNFDAYQNFTTLYNPKYYVDFINELGFKEECCWQQYKMQANQPIPDKVERINKLIMEKYRLRLLKFKKHRDIDMKYVDQFFPLINESFADLYDFVPLTPKEIDFYVKEYFPFAHPHFINFVVDENDKLVAFGMSVPDITPAYKKAKGHLFPFGWIGILRGLKKFDTIDLLLNGVLPEWQKRGVHSIYYAEMNQQAINHHVHTAYTNPQIVGNEAEKLWENTYKVEPLMLRAVFSKPC